MTEVTKHSLIDLIRQISLNIDGLKKELEEKNKEINKLKSINEDLQKDSKARLAQIGQYINELEKIRSHYVNSNNNT
jgi:uncharacterized protein YciW